MSHPDHDIDPLIKAEELARILGKPMNTVYDLPISKVWVGERTVRWKPEDVQDFIDERYDDVASGRSQTKDQGGTRCPGDHQGGGKSGFWRVRPDG